MSTLVPQVLGRWFLPSGSVAFTSLFNDTRAVMVATLLDRCEAWRAGGKHIQQLE